MEAIKINMLSLAYIGDAVYEVYVRKHLVEEKGLTKANELQKESIKFVSAKNQAFFLEQLMKENFFDEEELEIIRRARNTKVHSKPKNCDIITYKHATAFESVIGYLYEINKMSKFEIMFKKIITIQGEVKC